MQIFYNDIQAKTEVRPENRDYYYPFGLTLSSTAAGTEQPHKYNGKELTKNFGLEWYSYGAREYDPQIGRFPSIDRFSEKYYPMAPYQYGANNPILYVDINGDSLGIRADKNHTAIYHEGKLYNKDGTAYNGVGTKTDKNGNITLKQGFLKDAFNDLNKIRDGGEEGKKLVDGLDNRKEWTIIKESNTENEAKGFNVSFNPDLLEGGPDENGNTSRPSFVGLAHELGHVEDYLNNGTVDKTPWFTGSYPKKDYPNAEKYGSHVENKIRAENGIPLRKFYTKDAYGKGEGRLLIEGTRNSAHYNYTYPKKQE